jgi:phosphoribosylformimino-5-aminoimidazole carboxamide ribotide isomerase
MRGVIAIPAIDLRDGACVQLVGGSYDAERVRLEDPVAVARRWRDLGFRHLHVVDLDAATGRGCNDETVARILEASADVDVQVGGGVRSLERARALLASGASRVVAGTRALEDSEWLVALAGELPSRVVVAVDVRDSQPVVRGWSETIALDLARVVGSLDNLPLAGLLVTAVDVEGRLDGPDLALTQSIAQTSTHRITAAGGITRLEDLRTLAALGVWGAVIGMALYTGHMHAAQCAAEFGGAQ